MLRLFYLCLCFAATIWMSNSNGYVLSIALFYSPIIRFIQLCASLFE